MRQEGVKCVIFPKEKVQIQGKTLNKYIVAAIVISENEIENCVSETVAMGNIFGGLTDLLSALPKYTCDFKLGDLSDAILTIADLKPTDDCLTKINWKTNYMYYIHI